MYTRRIVRSYCRRSSVRRTVRRFSKTQTACTVQRSQNISKTLNQIVACIVAICACVITSSVLAGDVYFRGSIALDRYNDTVFMDSYCPSGTPAALYGCGTGSDNLPYSTKGGFDSFRSIEFGLGLITRSNFRFEFSIEYQPSVDFTGNTNFLPQELRQSVTAELSSVSGMFSGYLDFPQTKLLGKSKIVPYVGAGFGVARNQIDTTTMNFPVTITVVPGGSQMSIAWMTSLGLSMDVSSKAKLDLELRYSDLSRVRTARGEGSVNWRSGARGPLLLDLGRTEAELEGYSLRLSFRYSP